MLKHTNAKKARVSCRIRMESKQSEKPRPSTYDFWIRARKTTANDLDAPNFPQSSGWKHWKFDIVLPSLITFSLWVYKSYRMTSFKPIDQEYQGCNAKQSDNQTHPKVNPEVTEVSAQISWRLATLWDEQLPHIHSERNWKVHCPKPRWSEGELGLWDVNLLVF